MTNEMIVLFESVELMEQGVLKGTGKFVTVKGKDDEDIKLEIPEEIHTFATWKKLGYRVKKGERAVAQFPIWSYSAGKKAEDDDSDEEPKGRMYMKKASWFSIEQVEAIA